MPKCNKHILHNALIPVKDKEEGIFLLEKSTTSHKDTMPHLPATREAG
jgi:hypothetical protein